MRLIRCGLSLLLLSAAMLGGCGSPTGGGKPNFTAKAPDGYRYEYGGRESYVNRYGEHVMVDAPERIPVYRTRPGPETGPYGHEPLNPAFVGYEARDVPVMQEFFGMQPGQGQWPAQAYSEPPGYNPFLKTDCKPAKKNEPEQVSPRVAYNRMLAASNDADGFRTIAPNWSQGNYGDATNDWQERLSKLGRVTTRSLNKENKKRRKQAGSIPVVSQTAPNQARAAAVPADGGGAWYSDEDFK